MNNTEYFIVGSESKQDTNQHTQASDEFKHLVSKIET